MPRRRRRGVGLKLDVLQAGCPELFRDPLVRFVRRAKSRDAAPGLLTARAVGLREADDRFQMLADDGPLELLVLLLTKGNDGWCRLQARHVEDGTMRIA